MGEDRLQHANEAAIVDEILASIRHDVRDKLAAAREASQYVKRRVERASLGATDPRLTRSLALVEEQLALADRLLVQSGAIERVYQRAAAPLDMRGVVRRAIARVSLPHAVSVEIGRDKPYGDECEIVVALGCLLDNAARYTPEGGEIRIETLADDSGGYLIAVCDEGPGMTVSVFRRLLRGAEPSASGRGLGLAVARRLALRNSGSLKLLPAEKGARIALRLPLAP